MFKNYLKVALRNLIKNKVYSIVSVFGLSIGLAVCIMLFMYVQHELSYDNYHKNSENVYRLVSPVHPYHSPQVAKLLKDKLPEIKESARILPREDEIVSFGEKKFKEPNVAYVDPELFNLFSLNSEQGNIETALEKPFTIIISEKIAHKYFGESNPIGKVLNINNSFDYTVTGVFEEMPYNSHFRYDFFLTLKSAESVYGKALMNNFGWQNFIVYFFIPEEFSASALEAKCSVLMKNPRDKSGKLPEYIIQNIRDIHLYSSYIKYDFQPQSSITYVILFATLGFLILLIATFNYVNLLTASATTRVKEIGIRKVVGASRKQLSWQFIGESLIVLILAFFASLIIVEISLPIFNSLSGKAFSFSELLDVKTIFSIFSIILAISLVAGFYPVVFLSNYQPLKTLKASAYAGKSKINFRKLFVGVQFTIVIVLICCALFMFNQISFLQNKELGFDKEYLLTTDLNESFEDFEKYDAMKQVLLQEINVASVSSASRIPSNSLNNRGDVKVEGAAETIGIPYVHIHQDYFETFGIKALHGRIFSNELSSDINESIVLNEAAVKMLEIQGDPIGQSVTCNWPKSTRTIIGVVKDFHFESLYEPTRAAVFVPNYDMCHKLIVKINPSNAKSTINKIAAIGKGFYPEEIFEFSFLDEQLGRLYQTENNTFQLMGYFTMLAIFISCMGLFGLALFIMKSRTKEIGMRKVLGASIPTILFVLVKDFGKWVLIGNIIAWPIAFYIIDKWLQSFAFHIEINIWSFLFGGGIAFVVAILTVGYQAIKSATANPVESLRSE